MSAHLIEVIGAAAVAWAVRAYFWPYAPCRWCKGSGTNRGSSRKRFGDCRWCHGTRKRQVLGSRTLHRAVRGAVAYRRNRKDS